MEHNTMPAGAAAVAQRLADRKTLFHAYIISGPEALERTALARWLAAFYVCVEAEQAPCGACPGCRKAQADIHPDIVWPEDGAAINVAGARALRTDAYVRPNEAARKVYILEHAQQMNDSAQNALLKVLEDGPPYAAFLLLAENEAALLPTIRSRCEILRLAPPEESNTERALHREDALRLTGLLVEKDQLELLAFAVSLEKWDRPSLAQLLDETAACLRDRLMAGTGDARRLLMLSERIKSLRRACEFNIGAGHLAGWLAVSAGPGTD